MTASLLLARHRGGRYPAHIPSFYPQTTPWDRHHFFFIDEEVRLHVMPNSLGCLTQNQNLKQSDSAIVPSLAQILKIVKTDPSYLVTNCVDKFKLSRRCQLSHELLLMEKAQFFQCCRQFRRHLEDVTLYRCPARTLTKKKCSRKARSKDLQGHANFS